MVGYSHRSGVISTDLFYAPILTIKIIKMSKCLLFLSESSMNFYAKYPNLMGFCFLPGYIAQVSVLQPWKSHALNVRSDSTPQIPTYLQNLPKQGQLPSEKFLFQFRILLAQNLSNFSFANSAQPISSLQMVLVGLQFFILIFGIHRCKLPAI